MTLSIIPTIVPVTIIAGLVVWFAVALDILDRNYRRRMAVLAAERSGESICQFVRGLRYRQLDTGVIRQVYETIQSEIFFPDGRVPIRPTDDVIDLLEIHPDDFEDMIIDLAERCGRSLDDCEQNPYYHRLRTPGDVVHFLCGQPAC